VVKLGALIVFVFAAGALFGYGVFRYLESERNEDKGESNAKAPDKEKNEKAGEPDKGPRNGGKDETGEQPSTSREDKKTPNKGDSSSSPRKEDPPPKKEESPIRPPVKEEPPPRKEEPPVKVMALWNAYEKNAIAADEQYKGKWLRLTDHVKKITPDSVGFAVVGEVGGVSRAEYARMTPQERKWFDEGYPPNVVCQINPDHKSGFTKAQPGKPFTVIGRCAGVRKDPDVWMGRIIVLEDCRAAED